MLAYKKMADYAYTVKRTAFYEKKANIPDFIGDYLCCLIISATLSYVLLTRIGHEVGVGQCFLLAFISLALIFLFSHRWWLLPAFIAALALVFILVLWIFDLWEPVFEYAKGFYYWVSESYPLTLPYSENGSIFLVRLIVVIPLTVLIYIYLRKFFLFILLPAGTAVLVTWLYLAESEQTVTVLVLMTAAVVSAFAKYAGRYTGKRYFEEKRLSEGLFQVPALILAFFVLLFAFAFSPKEDGDWQSERLVSIVRDISDYWDFHSYGRSGSGSFSLSQAGFAPYDRLGGDISPNNEVIMRINTEMPSFLTGTVSDAYSGYSWYDANRIGRFRFNSILWQNAKREVFTIDKPLGGREANRYYNAMTNTVETRIGPEKRSLTIFGSAKVLSITNLTGENIDVYFNLQGELFYEEGINAYYRYNVKSVQFDRESDDFFENMQKLEEAVSKQKDGYMKEIEERYLSLPDSLPENVYTLTAELTEGISSAYGKAEAIERWIYENCEYTQTPGDVPEGRDFVDYFLETRQGYCTYYASAMTVMARCAGLPARYCTGFAMKQASDNNENSYVVTNSTAHAWSEIYFSGIGWLVFDPSQWNFYEPVTLDAPVKTPNVNLPADLGKPEEIGELPEEVLPELPAELYSERKSSSVWISVLLVISGFIVLVLLFVCVRLIITYAGAGNYYKRVKRRYPDTGSQLDAAYSKVLKQLSFIGLKLETGDTITSFAARADEKLGDSRMSRVCEPVIRRRFGLKEVKDADLRALCGFYADMEREIRAKMGLPRYLWYRVLLGR